MSVIYLQSKRVCNDLYHPTTTLLIIEEQKYNV